MGCLEDSTSGKLNLFIRSGMNNQADITGLLNELSEGSKKAFDKLFPLVYDRLRAIAYRQMEHQPENHTLSKTDLVHEVYLKLIDQKDAKWKDRVHFYAVASKAMRHILVDHARKKSAQKRGGNESEITFIDEIMTVEHQAEKELIQIDEALDKLAEFDDRMAKIVEYRYFGDMKMDDIAKVLDLSPRTIKRDWATARGWLYKKLS